MHHSPSFLLRALALALVLAAAATFGAARAAAAPNTSTTLGLVPASGPVGSAVTLSATVVGPGVPVGKVNFLAAQNGGTPTEVGSVTVAALPGSITTAQASFSTTAFAPGTYAITASFVSANFLTFDNSTSAPTLLTVAGTLVHNTKTTLTASPAVIVTGSPELLAAHVTTIDGSGIVPTGTVTFTDNGIFLGQADLDANGDAPLQVGGFVAGTHMIEASYQGDTADHSSGASVTLDAHDAQAGPVATSTTITLEPSVISVGDTVTIHVHLVQTGTPTPPLGSDDVTLMAGTTPLGQITVDGNGDATLRVAGWIAGDYDVRASYFGTVFGKPSTADAELSVVPLSARTATSLQLGAVATAEFDDATTLAATLRDASASPVAGAPVTLTLGAQSCRAVTGADGNVACDIVVAQPAGDYTVAASFLGDSAFRAARTAAQTTVTQETDTLVVSALDNGATSTIAATLLEDGALPIAGRTVGLSLGGSSCTATTGANGVATCGVTTPAAETATATAAFAGDAYYLPSSASTTVVLSIPTTTRYSGAASADFDDAAVLAATLLDAAGQPLSGRQLTLTAGSQSCVAVTDATGSASCTITVSQAAGTYPLSASFAGAGPYVESTALGTFVVTKEQSSMSSSLHGPVLAAGSIALTGTLSEDGVTPVAGRLVTLAIGSRTCTAVTNQLGAASCGVSGTGLIGPLATSASFAGDGYYLASSTTDSALVYGVPAGGGMFVIGDRSAAGAVGYWGAQWAKLNVLSQAAAPSSFKGFALTGATDCGGTWSTDPGNNSPPPAAPLPSYMAVVVASTASRSGSTIAGNVAHLVVVETNGDYDANPGHPATGTVVATIC